MIYIFQYSDEIERFLLFYTLLSQYPPTSVDSTRARDHLLSLPFSRLHPRDVSFPFWEIWVSAEGGNNASCIYSTLQMNESHANS
jgi:hypothetical protein